MEHKNITDLAYTYIGLVTTMTKHYVDEGVPLLFNSSIRAEGIDFSNPIYLDNEFAEDNKNRKHRTGDVITVHTGDIGTSAIIPDSLDGSLGFATIVTRIHDKNVLLPEYLCAYLNYGGGKEQLYKYARDIRNNLNLKDFNKLIVPVPDLYRQKEIVKNVNTLNKIVCQRKQELAFFDDLIKARFVELFGDPVVDEKGWNTTTLLGALEKGRTVSYGIVQTGDDVEDGIPVFRPIDIAGGHIPKREELKKTLPEISAKYKRTLLEGNELLITVRGSVGETFQVDEEFSGCNVGRNIVPLVTDHTRVNQRFLQELFSQQSIKNWLKDITKGIALQGLNMSEFKEMPVIVPPMDQQEQFVLFAKQIDKSKVAIQKSLDETQKLFDSLMQKYFG